MIDIIKESVEKNDFIIVNRDKNKTFMRRFRLNHTSIKKILLSLNYLSIDKIDEDINKNEFGGDPIVVLIETCNLVNFHGENEEVRIYIKIKMIKDKVVPVISFHEAEF